MIDDAGGHAALGDGTLHFFESFILLVRAANTSRSLLHLLVTSAKLLTCARASKEAEPITSRKQASCIASGGGLVVIHPFVDFFRFLRCCA